MYCTVYYGGHELDIITTFPLLCHIGESCQQVREAYADEGHKLHSNGPKCLSRVGSVRYWLWGSMAWGKTAHNTIYRLEFVTEDRYMCSSGGFSFASPKHRRNIVNIVVIL